MVRFRFIECETDPFSRFAFDEVGMKYSGQQGEGLVVFYKMNSNVVSISRIQNYTDVDLNGAKRYKLPIVRRLTSGSSVIHNDVGGDFSYSVFLPMEELPKRGSIPDSTQFRVKYSLDPIQIGLRKIGIETNLVGVNNLAIGKQKISSNSYASSKEVYNAAVVHGYIAYTAPRDMWSTVLRDDASGLIGIKEVTDATAQNAYDSILEAFYQSLFAKDSYTEPWSGNEKTEATNLVSSLYANPNWTENAEDGREKSLWTVKRTRSLTSCVSQWPGDKD